MSDVLDAVKEFGVDAKKQISDLVVPGATTSQASTPGINPDVLNQKEVIRQADIKEQRAVIAKAQQERAARERSYFEQQTAQPKSEKDDKGLQSILRGKRHEMPKISE